MKRTIVVLATLAICSLAAQNASAGANLGLNAVGFSVGIVSPEDTDATAGLGIMADHGTLAPNIRLMSHMDFWTKSTDDEPYTGTTVSIRDLQIGARGEYMFPTKQPKFLPFAGAGLGLHFLHASVESPGFPDMDDSSTKLGLDIGGGFTSPVSPKADFRTEMWYGIVEDFSQLSIKAGFAFKLGS